ncbi:uncharacterized protein LOC106883806 isoform X2 [Octopus bimaculoides]|uniref:uncharacterized protein LOC106883806 isoform X2 n=1 Tax=Octopus bimaculoides TaxID=37653 RepID=UPI0022E7E005|nr:uncharacterized protein LOC106883806 isoform X2 [Octopus bimaculoides]
MITKYIFLFPLAFFMSCTEVTSQEPCDSYTEIDASSRRITEDYDTHCDNTLSEKWYRFIIGKQSAIIPTQCIKNDFCGTKLGMFIDMMNQSFPSTGNTITVTACSSFDILGKWDCCVLSKRIEMRRCPGDFFIYNLKKTDRCPVAYCSMLQNELPHDNYTILHGAGVNETSPFVSTKDMIKDLTTLETPVISSIGSNAHNLTTTEIQAQNFVTVNQTEKDVHVESATRFNVTTDLPNSSVTNILVTKTKKGRRNATVTAVKTTTEDEDSALRSFGSGEEKETAWKEKYSIPNSTVSPAASHRTSITPVITAFEKTVTPNQTITAEPSQDIFQEYLALFIILMIIGFLCLILLLSSCMYLYCQRHSGHWDRALAEQYHVTVVPRRDALINESPYSDDVIIHDEKEDKLGNSLGSSYHGVNPGNNLSYSNSIKAINDLNNLTMRSHPNDFNSQPLDGTEGLVIPIDQFRPEKDTMNIEDTIL